MTGSLGLIPEIFKPMHIYTYIRLYILFFFYVNHSTLGTLLSALYNSRVCSILIYRVFHSLWRPLSFPLYDIIAFTTPPSTGWNIWDVSLSFCNQQASINNLVYSPFCACTLSIGQIPKVKLLGQRVYAFNILINVIKIVDWLMAPLSILEMVTDFDLGAAGGLGGTVSPHICR